MLEALVPKHVVLWYWPCRGRAQALADFLLDRRVAFDDKRLTWDGRDWAAMREDRAVAGPFASLPVLQWGDQVLSEALPIAGFLNRVFSDPSRGAPGEAIRHDMFCSAAYLDVSRQLADLVWCRVDYPDVDFSKRARIVLPRALAKLRRIGAALDQRTPYVGGDTPAVADFFVLEALEELVYLMGAQAGLLADVLPELSAHRERLRARPALDSLSGDSRPRRFTNCPQEPEALAELESFPWQKLCSSISRS